ncbi:MULTISPECIES: long-chain fatty acid--CoA ligase [Paenibacillus]|uniref:long-chain-fatty-acid--CoA ligase n=1 Tax=Paenibacillus TaxID=44249 RepID=UPI00088ADB66|nr:MULTISPECIES: long-chain fatty acid--CoA ligase [Paenibacillus]NTZ17262.1 long-chain fatty acid--CoA ligase [Paenibacillus sp. JMULE4]SDI14729.1 long-chain acyl-CoA synthetase [Paenibacillus naphthalenovorans]
MTSKPWLKHYPAEVPPTFDYPKQNLAHFLKESAQTYPKHIALDFLGKKISYRELLDSAYRFANTLIRLGVRKGNRVAIMLPNCPQTVIAYYGTLLMGGVVVMTNPMYTPRELEYQLKDSGATVIVTLDLLFDRVYQVKEKAEIRQIIVTSIKDYLPIPQNWLYPLFAKLKKMKRDVIYGEGVYSFVKLLRRASPEPCGVKLDAENDLALIQYTGGTTGRAKGVMLTHYNLVANTIQNRLWSYRSKQAGEVYLSALPFFHVFGLTVLLNKSVYLAGTMALLPRFEIALLVETVRRVKPTIFPGAPTMYAGLIRHALTGSTLSSLEVCVSGAAPLPAEIQQKFEAMTGARLVEGYGLTEASPVTHANNIWEKRKIGSIGIPLPDTEARIVDPDHDTELPAGEIGELIVRGPQVMKGYWNRPEDTAAALRDGWLYTGDMAKMDEDGFFTILDRKKDLIIAGGYNVYPREVEEVLYEHPEVEEAVVAGVSDPYRGETVKAYLVMKKNSEAGAEELNLWCRQRLAAYKVPHVYEFRETLPKSLVGKVLRRKLEEEEAEKTDDDTVES